MAVTHYPAAGDSVVRASRSVTGGLEILSGGNRTSLPIAAGSSGIPFVMPSRGTINNTAGSVTVATAFDYVIGPSYTYFPAAALHAASPAGWYYTLWTAATIGTVYADTYQNGIPTIPASPTALVTVAGAYTQAINFDVTGPNYVIPGGTMGVNGYIEWGRTINNNNSAGAKVYNVYLGGSLAQGTSQTTNPKHGALGTIKNRGRVTAQISTSGAAGDPGNASSLPKLTIDTAQNQVISMSLRLAVATDFAMIESHHVRVWNA